MNYNLQKPWETLDDWQKEYIHTSTNCVLVAGRQVGKSTAMSIKIGERALLPNRDILVIALTEKQAYQMFYRTLLYMQSRYPKLIVGGKDKPTKHEFKIKNKQGNSVVRCYATGLTGVGLRGFTITDLFIDEAREIAREVFTSVLPMLNATNGTVDVASTPGGTDSYFYDCARKDDPAQEMSNAGFKTYHVSAEECPRVSKEKIEWAKKNMTKLEYAQEYLGNFLDNVMRLFDDELLKMVCTLQRRPAILEQRKYFGGADIARLGKDQSTIEILDATDPEMIEQVESIFMTKTRTTETTKAILDQQRAYKMKGIGIDGAGVGGGVFDELLTYPETREIVQDLNNATKPLDWQGEKSKHLLKEEMYINLSRLMEHMRIKLLNDEELIRSLKSVLYEYDDKGKVSFFGNYTHLTEGLIRAAWLAVQDKSLKVWIESV